MGKNLIKMFFKIYLKELLTLFIFFIAGTSLFFAIPAINAKNFIDICEENGLKDIDYYITYHLFYFLDEKITNDFINDGGSFSFNEELFLTDGSSQFYGNEIAGLYNTSTKNIEIKHGCVEEVLFHEMGHYVYFTKGVTDYSPIWEKEKVSDYASINEKEGFAVVFDMYTNPFKRYGLKKNFPLSYEYMKEFMDNYKSSPSF